MRYSLASSTRFITSFDFIGAMICIIFITVIDIWQINADFRL